MITKKLQYAIETNDKYKCLLTGGKKNNLSYNLLNLTYNTLMHRVVKVAIIFKPAAFDDKNEDQ